MLNVKSDFVYHQLSEQDWAIGNYFVYLFIEKDSMWEVCLWKESYLPFFHALQEIKDEGDFMFVLCFPPHHSLID